VNTHGQGMLCMHVSCRDKSVLLALNARKCSDKEEAEQYLRKNRWNVQDALRFALNSNPGLPLFDGQVFI